MLFGNISTCLKCVNWLVFRSELSVQIFQSKWIVGAWDKKWFPFFPSINPPVEMKCNSAICKPRLGHWELIPVCKIRIILLFFSLNYFKFIHIKCYLHYYPPINKYCKALLQLFMAYVYYWKCSGQGVQEWFLGQMWDQSYRQDLNWIDKGEGWKLRLEWAGDSFEKIRQRTGKIGTDRWAVEVAAQLHGQLWATVQNYYKAWQNGVKFSFAAVELDKCQGKWSHSIT